MSRTVYEVGPRAGQWHLMRPGASRAIGLFDRKRDAVKRGVQIARSNQPSQLIIKRADGTIEDERTYGSDTFPPGA